MGERALAKASSLVGLGERLYKIAAPAALHFVSVIDTAAAAAAAAAALPAVTATAAAAAVAAAPG